MSPGEPQPPFPFPEGLEERSPSELRQFSLVLLQYHEETQAWIDGPLSGSAFVADERRSWRNGLEVADGTDADYYLYCWMALVSCLHDSVALIQLAAESSSGSTSVRMLAAYCGNIRQIVTSIHDPSGEGGLAPFPLSELDSELNQAVEYPWLHTFIDHADIDLGRLYARLHTAVWFAADQLSLTAANISWLAEGHPLAQIWAAIAALVRGAHAIDPDDYRSIF